MEMAKVTTKGQITIPVSIRRLLGVKEGDKVLFVEDNGRVMLLNASMQALAEAQKAFAGTAEEMDIQGDDDVVAMVKEIREERKDLYKCE